MDRVAHGHGHRPWDASGSIDRALWLVVGAWALATLVGVVALWPGAAEPVSDLAAERRVEAEVIAVVRQPCTGTQPSDGVECRVVTVRITSGPTEGDPATLELGVNESKARTQQVDDDLILNVQELADGTIAYTFADYERRTSMLVLTALFIGAVVLLGRWRGVGALAGLAVSVVVLVSFVLPALLDGSNPVSVALVGASVIAFASLYLAHGFNTSTNVALISTLASLATTGVLAWIFVHTATLTGLADESSLFLEALGVTIDPRGLLLAGVVIGSLGVLDDVTVTQVSAVGELRRADPGASTRELARSALTIGRDHVSSTVNTLFLAYAGAALPLLLLFTQIRQGIGDVVVREQVAVEVVRTLVGSIGLVAAVPISTWLAALVSRPPSDALSG